MTPRLTIGPTIKLTTDSRGFVTVEAPRELITEVTDARAAHNAAWDMGRTGGVFVFKAGAKYGPFGDQSGVLRVPSTYERPLILMSDDATEDRPIVESRGTGACLTKQRPEVMARAIHMLGLALRPEPGATGINSLGDSHAFIGDDLDIYGGQLACAFQGDSNGNPWSPCFSNTIVHGQRRTTGHAQGFFFAGQLAYPELDHCIIDDIGESNFEHGVYQTNGSGKLWIHSSIVTRIHAGHAFQGRGGLDAENNLIARCAAGTLCGGGDNPQADRKGVDVHYFENVHQEATGIGWGLELSNTSSGKVSRNLWAHGPNAAFAVRCTGPGQGLGSGVGVTGVTIEDNVWDDWRGGMEILDGRVTFRQHSYKARYPGRSIQTYYRGLQNDEASDCDSPLKAWVRIMATPQPGDFEAFIAAAKRAMSYHRYDPRYTAPAVNQYMREGRGM